MPADVEASLKVKGDTIIRPCRTGTRSGSWVASCATNGAVLPINAVGDAGGQGRTGGPHGCRKGLTEHRDRENAGNREPLRSSRPPSSRNRGFIRSA
jgi:hypothetical protein